MTLHKLYHCSICCNPVPCGIATQGWHEQSHMILVGALSKFQRHFRIAIKANVRLSH